MNNERLFHASEMLVISREISVFVYEEITRGEGSGEARKAVDPRDEKWSIAAARLRRRRRRRRRWRTMVVDARHVI